jgi:hypothetical protein
MAKRFVVPFATGGDKSVTPDATDPGGAISYTQGWPSAYQLPNTDPAYRPVGRQEMNGVLNDITGALVELQTIGFPEWVAVAGLVVPYRINAYVRHTDVVWRSKIANNSDEPGVGAGATSWENVSGGASGILVGTQIFKVNGTYTPTAGTVYIDVEVVGGGGSGGYAPTTGAGTASAGGGGSSGGYTRKKITSAFSGLTVTVGAGGIGITTGSNPGADSSFGSLAVAPGGLGANTQGPSNQAFGAAGGVGAIASTTGDINAGGTPGVYGLFVPSGAGGLPYGGSGAPSFFGGGGSYNTGVGGPGTAPGAGGAGAANSVSSAVKAGGNGAAGIVIIREYK